ncbi:MAG: TIGR00270 family protein [Methanomicrobia archaeon]|nr:TIGR00270 family protein [Methanomicrobia archaeon]
MICEICGKEFRGRGTEIYVDGAQLRVCPNCTKFGTKVEPHKEERKPYPQKKKEKRPLKSERDNFTIIPDYSEIIKNSREGMKFSQKELAFKINEKESVIHRLETRSMSPSYTLAKKLEKALKIKIIDKISEVEIPKLSMGSKNLTIGDIIKIKKK